MIIIKKNTWISWIHPMRVLAAYGSSDSGYRVTQMAKQKKNQYNNTKFIVLDSGVASSEPLLVCASVGGPPAAGRRSPCSWILFGVSCHRFVVKIDY